ncbi:MAG: HmuY family protein [Gemmatimonadota bacterium]
MRLKLWSLVGAVLVASACNGDSSGPGPTNPAGIVELDASSTTLYAYFDLAAGQAVTVAAPSTSTTWTLAFRRYEVRVNGGVAGPGGVSGYNLANNAGATNQQVLAFTPENQKAAFDAIGVADIPVADSFVTERLVANPLGFLNFAGGSPAANTSAAWKVRRTAGGGFAAFHVVAVTIGGSTPETAGLATATVEWRYQPADGTLGAADTLTIDVASGSNALDFATGTAAAPSGCDWDIEVGADFTIATNAACDVGTFPLDAAQSFAGLTTAGDALDYGLFLSGLTGPIPFSTALDDPAGPFLYNLAGDNRLSPTFNIYLVKVGDAVYKFQLIGYYNATGAGGHPSIRYAKLR